MANIAIFGGTFNPFHIGHYEMLRCVCNLDFIDKVLVIPDKIPPHKSCDYIADDTHRIEMCGLACKDFCKAQLCLIEFEREGKSYTVDTVKLLKQRYSDDSFYVVIGGDMLSTLDKWHDWQKLITLASFIAFKRIGQTDFELSYNRLSDEGANIMIVNDKITEVSSTQLRKKIQKNLLPEKIYNYIIEKGIYNV